MVCFGEKNVKKPAPEILKNKVESSRGLVLINTGNGKGKTTAALGMVLRAWGHDMKVVVLQFIKDKDSNYGEHHALSRMGIEIIAGGAGFVRPGVTKKYRRKRIFNQKIVGLG